MVVLILLVRFFVITFPIIEYSRIKCFFNGKYFTVGLNALPLDYLILFNNRYEQNSGM